MPTCISVVLVMYPGVYVWFWYCAQVYKCGAGAMYVQVCKCGSWTVSRCIRVSGNVSMCVSVVLVMCDFYKYT
jgi:hypothetical protein